MSINLEKNRQKIVTAWKDVLDDKTSTDWALFGYEAQTNDLKVVETGDGGLDELSDELNSGKIMYAFVRVADPKTSLNKYVLINWQGEGAPVLRKGTCANHIRDVEKLLNGAHLTINARVEDDVEKDRIFDKVSAVGSAYSFKEHKFVEETQKGPIGTAYSRVNPAKEINAKERDNFWRKEEEEEKKRVVLEKERKKTELIKTEEERRVREEKEHTERERRIAIELNSPTSTNNNNNNNINNSFQTGTARSPVMPLSPTIHQQTESRGPTQAEIMRQQRNQEAKELIGSRVGTAKAIFSQNSASGQMNAKAAPAKPVRNSIAQRINSLTNQQQPTEMKKTNFIDECKQSNVAILEKDENIEIIGNQKDEEEQMEKSEIIDNEIKQEILTNGKIIDKNNEIMNKQQEEIIPNFVEETAPSPQPEYDNDDDDDDQFSTIKRSPHNKTSTTSTSQAATPVDDIENRTTNLMLNSKMTDDQNQNDIMPDDPIMFPDMLGDIGQRAKALYDYQAADESEITFDPNDIITHIDQIDEGWWQGLGPDGTYGLFPANYVELIKD